VRLIATDLDGTLLTSDQIVSPRTVAALRAAVDRDVVIALATGRPPESTRRIVDLLDGLVSYVIAVNGSIVSQVIDGQFHLAHIESFDRALADEAVVRLRAGIPGMRFALATEHGFAFEPGFAERVPDPPDAMESVADIADHPGTTAFKLFAFHPAREVRSYLDEMVPLVPEGLVPGHMGLDGAEVSPAGIDKASGLARLCERLGLDAADVVAFGDNLNDHSMLQWAGLGVAMANADRTTQAVADEITVSNDDDGVAVVLERLLSLDAG
jgi:hydroxymethylpyrimidine pyrophosphatase-like HAD family hydrolase